MTTLPTPQYDIASRVHGFITTITTPIPEPSTFALLGFGAGAFYFIRKRRK